ncbi:hypothetical protein CONPUDRAFT_57605 [Coniophora puteana RWD-64-598 SS2]|uniref:Non-ribosomal peptide synthetase n=1 Tax=Coniophora puteana (strain RWD-64-598) TaxID=741705 RepID=A0A5M3MNE1_CONPW|nr:uncharacterized protein CONPUDRAFT_57605 [Coniophora puteana RWD-64-598 SS2]EIW80688.1 hypothetical protein CONPUDRAFT_57605 [Coniophora puteana RWD-64-598 SS2]
MDTNPVVTSNPTFKPNPKRRRPSPWIRLQLWFNTYRKFFTLVVSMNTVGLALAISGRWTYPRHYTGAFVLGNLQTAIITRNELFMRVLYLFVNTCLAKWTPLRFRLACTSALQHIGGIHSGCAISGFLWLVYRITNCFIALRTMPSSMMAAGVMTNIAIAVCIVSAFPWIRNNHHNVFERHHRFVGWCGLVSTWVFVILGDMHDPESHSWDPTVGILRQQDFWFVFIMTVFTIIPWLTVRRVNVDVELPSPKVAVLRFERGMQQGLLARISRECILEYHAFGIILEGKCSKYHYLICGVQGDFTRRLFAGVSNTSTLYTRGIRVCTGTGLGAALSTCLQSPYWYLIWIGSDQEKTFGPTISGLIHQNLSPERMTLWDSKKEGRRPDVMKLVRDAYISWQAEVVFITSNHQGNQEIMEGCKEAGIPAFGTLWDF